MILSQKVQSAGARTSNKMTSVSGSQSDVAFESSLYGAQAAPKNGSHTNPYQILAHVFIGVYWKKLTGESNAILSACFNYFL